MQQLFSAFGIDWHLLIAQAVNFGIVLIALWYFLYTPVLTMLRKRQEVVEQGVQDALRAGEMLAGADSEVLKRVTAADQQAEKIVATARESANMEKIRLLKEAETRAVAVTNDAEERAVETAARFLRESEEEVARLGILAAAKILKNQYD